MTHTGDISKIAYKRLRAGVYNVTQGGEDLGQVRGDYRAGFWAYLNDERLEGTHATVTDAADVLALEAAIRRHPAARAASTTRATVRPG